MATEAIRFLTTVGLGAGLMYLLDPQLGKRRRTLIRDKGTRLVNQADEGLRILAQDLGNRSQRVAAAARHLSSHESVDDDVLVERIRSRMGRVVSHPRAIQVKSRQGRVVLSGPILAEEAGRLVRCAWSVPGVREVENRLETHAEAGTIPQLQGGHQRPGGRSELFQNRWSPTMRFLVGATGVGLLGYGMTRTAPSACLLGTAGLCLVGQAIANKKMTEIVQETTGRIAKAQSHAGEGRSARRFRWLPARPAVSRETLGW